MTYVKVSIPRNDEGGAATVKNPTIILLDINDVETEPTHAFGTAELTGNFAMATGKTGVGVYATPSSISLTEEQSGDVDSRGIAKGVEFVHPGDSKAVSALVEGWLNRPAIIIVRDCDSASSSARVIGSKCNPAYLQPEYTNSKDGRNRKLVFKQDQPDKFVIPFYSGTIPALAADAAAEQGA